MSTTNGIQVAINTLSREGFVVEVKHNHQDFTIEVNVRRKNMAAAMRIADLFDYKDGAGDVVITQAIYECARKVENEEHLLKASVTPSTPATNNRIAELERELEKYKAAVKQLSFDLEMASSNPNAAASVKQIRKVALEQAAEFVMDYGIPTDGRSLEELCKQITKLKETRRMSIERAASAMSQTFGTPPYEVPF
jgi:type IV secretory pathway VirJ component